MKFLIDKKLDDLVRMVEAKDPKHKKNILKLICIYREMKIKNIPAILSVESFNLENSHIQWQRSDYPDQCGYSVLYVSWDSFDEDLEKLTKKIKEI